MERPITPLIVHTTYEIMTRERLADALVKIGGKRLNVVYWSAYKLDKFMLAKQPSYYALWSSLPDDTARQIVAIWAVLYEFGGLIATGPLGWTNLELSHFTAGYTVLIATSEDSLTQWIAAAPPRSPIVGLVCSFHQLLVNSEGASDEDYAKSWPQEAVDRWSLSNNYGPVKPWARDRTEIGMLLVLRDYELHASSRLMSLPGGSWRTSGRIISYKNGLLKAQLQDKLGRWRNSSINVTEDMVRKGLHNDDGQFAIK